MIPTLSKSKVPRTHSYPVGAEEVSEALSGAPQYAALGLKFWCWTAVSEQERRLGRPLLTISVDCGGGPVPFAASKAMIEAGHFEAHCTLTVEAVPRTLRNEIRGKIIAEALPSIRDWLVRNPDQASATGVRRIRYHYDEAGGALVVSGEDEP